MIIYEAKGNRATILKVSSYSEEITKHWYLIVELNQVRKQEKVAYKFAKKHVDSLSPTSEWLAEQKLIKKAKKNKVWLIIAKYKNGTDKVLDTFQGNKKAVKKEITKKKYLAEKTTIIYKKNK